MTYKSVSLTVLAAAAMVGVIAAPVAAREQSQDDQEEARKEMRAANYLKLREIERRVLPQMRGFQYLGPVEYPSRTGRYRLKFIKEGRVTLISVDARTGRIIR
ncbi:MAG: hypothetical protein AAGK02_06410 [Pseudomonadota bacterium]